ncbi:hypothetical protein KEM48_005798, partial [Puccinia striiformis f. sp. tritici PST-130]
MSYGLPYSRLRISDRGIVEYTQATLARLGLRVWAPDLDDSPHSLYNEACRQAALKTL